MPLLFLFMALLCGNLCAQDATLPANTSKVIVTQEKPLLTPAVREWQGTIALPDNPPPQRETARFLPWPYDENLDNSESETIAEAPDEKAFYTRVPPRPNSLLMTNEEIAPWLQRVAAQFPDKTRLWRLTQTAQGRFVWGLEIRPSNVPLESLRRLAIVCRQHGDEPESSAAGAELIYQLLQDTARNQKILSRVALFIIPVANPDGAIRKRRLNAIGQDLNRDWGRGGTREVSAMMYHLQNWAPQLIIDVHQWVPGDRTQTPMAEAAGGTLGRQVGAVMAQAARQKGYALSYRSHGVSNALLHYHYGWHRGIPAILLETVHRPRVPQQRQIAINTSVVALQRAIDFLAQ